MKWARTDRVFKGLGLVPTLRTSFFNEVSLLMGSILVDENGITWCRNGYPEYSPNCFRLSSSFTLKRCVGGHEDCHKDCTLGSIIRPRQHEDCRWDDSPQGLLSCRVWWVYGPFLLQWSCISTFMHVHLQDMGSSENSDRRARPDGFSPILYLL